MAISYGSELIRAAYVFPLVMAGLSDGCTLRIPNRLTLLLAGAFPAAALLCGHPVDVLSHLAAGGAVLAGAAILFALRAMGGGDVKLLAATALWTGLGGLAPFLALTAVTGGILALGLVLLRRCGVVRDMPVPYGIAIAVAGLAIAPSLAILA